MMEALRTHIGRYTQLSEEEFEYVSSFFHFQSHPKGSLLIKEGDSVEDEYFVLSGYLKAFYTNAEDKTYILQFAGKNWWVSDYHALYTGEKAKIQLDCIRKAEVLSLRNADREKICREIHSMEYFFRQRTNLGYAALQNRILSMMNQNAKERYEAFQKQYPDMIQHIPKHLIASYLGLSRETLSRLYHPPKL